MTLDTRTRRRLKPIFMVVLALSVVVTMSIAMSGVAGDDPLTIAAFNAAPAVGGDEAPNRIIRRSLVAAGALAATVATVVAFSAVTGDEPPMLQAFNVGVTHTQISADSWHEPDAVDRARDVLRDTVTVQNQHLMGFGTLNPNPGPGDYDWSTLDGRIEIIRDTDGLGVLTLCCAPDWMKGGEVGETDWTRIETAPDPEHFDDFAALAAEAAARYSDIDYFLVWNELKGFFDNESNRWDAESYTAFYNQVYTAVKEVRPDAMIGGPYVVMDSWEPGVSPSHPSGIAGPWGELDQRPLDVIDFWLDNAVGADFIVVDGRSWGYGEDSAVDPVVALEKFAVVNDWIAGRTELPIWWAEYYVDHPRIEDQSELTDIVRLGLEQLEVDGVQTVLLWDPNGTGRPGCGDCLWADVEGPEGGTEQPLATEVRDLNSG